VPTAASLARAPRRRAAVPDAICMAAVALARAAAQDVADPATVGEYLDAIVEGDRLVTHRFASTARGYRGWLWAVTVARASRAKAATVDEVVLLPGEGALTAPQWVPWAERLAPGDLGHADVLPYEPDDPRLEPGFEATGDEDVDAVALWELGLGRPRVLSRTGRQVAADRWYAGSHGPFAESAQAAAAQCRSCGFFVPVAGALRSVFGICANEWSPSDGRVVSLDHGCGAHSETDVHRSSSSPAVPVLDETGHEVLHPPPSLP
jgi:Protein of unknown function (DUF3027)